MTESEVWASWHTPRTGEGVPEKAMWGYRMLLDGCPFGDSKWIPEKHETFSFCSLTKKECNFGLTAIKAPDDCPLRTRCITVALKPE